jgi:SAM-dependent methyltransferase
MTQVSSPLRSPRGMPTREAAFLDAVIQHGLFSNARNLRFWMESFFGQVPLEGRRILDIGGGIGLLSIYAVCRGARAAVCLEPESDGVQTSNSGSRFAALCDSLGIREAEFAPLTLQDYLRSRPDSFDVVCSCNSINHLNEQACISIRKDPVARDSYIQIFRDISAMMTQGGDLIVTDCSPRNLYPHLGISNPFAPTIEWHKHQTPETWASLLEEAGFADSRITWLTFNGLGLPGRALLGNRPASYMLRSHFRLEMRRLASAGGSPCASCS